MPRSPEFRTEVFRDLYRQMRYAPAKTRRREMEAIERLIDEIDPRQRYPVDFVVYRVTGYRPELGDATASVGGDALLDELGRLLQRFCRALELPQDYEGRVPLSLDEVAQRLHVSRKTVQRYRRRGLVCHEVVRDDGRRQVVCFQDALDRFMSRHSDRVERAAHFSRMDAGARDRIIDDARTLHEQEGLTLHQVARRLARRHGRALETVRQLLHRHDRTAATPVFGQPGPLGDRDVRLIWRARRLGVPAVVLARHFGKSLPTIHRAVNRRRAELLRDLDIRFVPLPTLEREDAETVILAAPAVSEGLDVLLPDGDALALLAAARAADPVDEATEAALVAGLNLLKRRAGLRIVALESWPASGPLDEIETDLRWAALLHHRLVSLGLPPVLRTTEQHLHRRLDEQPGEVVQTMIRLAVEVVSRTVGTIDPSRSQRLEGRCAQAMDRALAALQPRRSVGRAAARHEPGRLRLTGAFEGLCPWEAWLAMRVDWRPYVGLLEPSLARLVRRHFGLDGAPPCSVSGLGAEAGMTKARAAEALQRAEITLRRLAGDDRHRREHGNGGPPGEPDGG